jgi:hypothetical protein
MSADDQIWDAWILVEEMQELDARGEWMSSARTAEELARIDPEAAWQVVMGRLPELPAKRKISEREQRAMPLSDFSFDHQVYIWAQIGAPKPPDRYIYFGSQGNRRALAMSESRGFHEWYWRRGRVQGEYRPPIPAWLRAAVIARDEYVCGLCYYEVAPDDLHLDHIKPWSKGGEHTLENLQVTHSWCNLAKGAKV